MTRYDTPAVGTNCSFVQTPEYTNQHLIINSIYITIRNQSNQYPKCLCSLGQTAASPPATSLAQLPCEPSACLHPNPIHLGKTPQTVFAILGPQGCHAIYRVYPYNQYTDHGSGAPQLLWSWVKDKHPPGAKSSNQEDDFESNCSHEYDPRIPIRQLITPSAALTAKHSSHRRAACHSQTRGEA